MGFQFVVDHRVDLFLQESGLLIVESAIFLELAAKSIFCHFEVVLHDHKRIMQDVF